MKSTNFAFAVLLVVLVSFKAQADTITFDAHPMGIFGFDGSTPIFDSGFRFDVSAAGWAVAAPGSSACCDINYNGTPSLFADGDRNGSRAYVDMTTVGGSTFTVSALDASVYWIGASGTLELIGSLLGGDTVTASYAVSSTWQSIVLPNTFTDLVSLRFQDSQSGGFLGAPGFGVDNISIDSAPAAIPEPSTLTLLGIGVVGLIGYGWRHSRG